MEIMLQRKFERLRASGDVVNPIKVVLAMSSVRRYPQGMPEYLWATVDSIVPFLGIEGRFEISLVIVDVEAGDGEWKRIIEDRYRELLEAGLVVVTHLSNALRESLYANLTQTCKLHRFYADDMQRVIWRSKRVLDFVHTVEVAAFESDYVVVLEDDTPLLGNLQVAVSHCHDLYGPYSKTACRWDWYFTKKDAMAKLVNVKESAHLSPRVVYSAGTLAGLFVMMLPTPEWKRVASWSRVHFDKAPADWLVGQWLFIQNFRMAYMPNVLNCYHAPTRMTESTLSTVQLSSLPLFKEKALSWKHCPQTLETSNHPFKWELTGPRFRLHWVGGSSLFLEVPWTDMEGHDLGIARDAKLLDIETSMYICEKTPPCKAVNKGGWMKEDFVFSATSAPSKEDQLFVRIPENSSEELLKEIRSFYEQAWERLPTDAKKEESHKL